MSKTSTSGNKKQLGQWMRLAERAGWVVRRTKSSHLRWISPAGQVVITPSSPGEGRAMLNTRSQLRRAGLHL